MKVLIFTSSTTTPLGGNWVSKAERAGREARNDGSQNPKWVVILGIFQGFGTHHFDLGAPKLTAVTSA